MFKQWKRFSMVTAGVFMASGLAMAGAGMGGDSGQSTTFKKLDQDGDGKISKEEARQADKLSQKFDEVDTDNNDELDKGEFARFEVGSSDSPGASDSGQSSGSDR